jgi:hypothetical protein
MRKIEQRILDAINQRKPLLVRSRLWNGSSLGPLQNHDQVTIDENCIEYRLIDTCIARIWPKAVEVTTGGYPTKSTKNRLNAILREYCATGIVQRKGIWTIGSLLFFDGMAIPRVR